MYNFPYILQRTHATETVEMDPVLLITMVSNSVSAMITHTKQKGDIVNVSI